MPPTRDPRVVLVGARPNGSSKVLLEILRLNGVPVVGLVDENEGLWQSIVMEMRVLGGVDGFSVAVSLGATHVALAVGDNHSRERLLREAERYGLHGYTAVHPSAVVSTDAEIGEAVWIAAGVVCNPGSIVGRGAVLNTAATVDHDCHVGAFANISPGCHLSGRVVVEDYAFLGTGAVVLPDVTIGEGAIVAAGAVVTRSVAPRDTVMGVPARPAAGRGS